MPVYDVEYAINRSETYRVEAKTQKEAEEKAFAAGELVDSGEANACVPLDVKKVRL